MAYISIDYWMLGVKEYCPEKKSQDEINWNGLHGN
jgi:hypothetical protein